MSALRLSPALLAATLLVSACGGGDDTDSPAADQAATPSPSVAVSISATPKVGKATAKPSAAPTVAATKAATPKASTPAKASYRIAMPDGRTSPTKDDWKFANFKLEQKNLQRSATVDVTYTGPGLASMDFVVFIKATYAGPFGEQTDTFEMQGFVAAIQADATEEVRLLGGGQADSLQQDATFEPAYTVMKVSDDDPKARAE